MTLDEIFPAFALSITAGPISLHGLRTEDVPTVTALAVSGIHTAGFLPFLVSWSEAPADGLPLSSAR